MRAEVRKENPAYVLRAKSYNGEEEPINVSFADLRNAKVGDRWENTDSHNCGRDLFEESAEVVYKTDKGAAVLFRSWGTTDEPEPRPMEGEPELTWFEFISSAQQS